MKTDNEKTVTVSSMIQSIVDVMCDKYCKYPNEEGHEDDWLLEDENSPYNSCPLVNLL